MAPLNSPLTCEQFETLVSEHVDGALAPPDRAVMDAHIAQCESCRALHAEISTIVSSAAVLPPLSPSRDLWAGIAERLDTPVVAIGTSGTHAVQGAVSTDVVPFNVIRDRKRSISLRQFAAAAVLIIAASSGATFVLTRTQTAESGAAASPSTVASQQAAPQGAINSAAPSPQVAELPTTAAPSAGTPVSPPTSQVSVAREATTGTRERARYATNNGGLDLVYEREITNMRRIVDERLGDLDSVTVVEIERNLQIIDKAIADSRRALEKDPRSRFLSSQLDRALETKLGVLRRIALL